MKRNLVTFGVAVLILGAVFAINQFDPQRIWERRQEQEGPAAQPGPEEAGDPGQNLKAEGKAFLAENAQKEGVVVLPSGLQYKVIREGAGAIPTLSDNVKIHYRGTLIDGRVFDDTVTRGQPATMGVAGLIPGWIEALMMMQVGAKWELYIPSDLAYGFRGSPPRIPSNATLIFEVELLEIVEPMRGFL